MLNAFIPSWSVNWITWLWPLCYLWFLTKWLPEMASLVLCSPSRILSFFFFFFLMDFFAYFFMPKWGNLKYSNWNVKLNNSWKQHFCAAKSSVRSATCDKLQWGVSERSLTPHEAVHESGPDFTLHKIIVLIYEKQKCV